MYRMEHGVVSLLLDDDNCDCYSTLSFGHGMCFASFNPSYGTENSFGVDLLYENGCGSPASADGLWLYFQGIPEYHITFTNLCFVTPPPPPT